MPLLWDFLQWEGPNLALVIHLTNRYRAAASQALSVLGAQWVSVSMRYVACGATVLSVGHVIPVKSHLGRKVWVTS